MKYNNTLKSYLFVFSVVGGVFASVMSGSMLVISFQEISESFSISFSTLQWRTTLFFSLFAVCMPFFGKMATFIGYRRQFFMGMFLFICATFLSACTGTWWIFLIFQGIQAISNSMIISVMPALMRKHIHEERLGWAFGLESAILSFGSLIGPPLGWMISASYGWQYNLYFLSGIAFVFMLTSFFIVPPIEEFPKKPSNMPFLSTASLLLVFMSAQLFFSTKTFRLLALVLGVIGAISIIKSELRPHSTAIIIPKGVWKNENFLKSVLRILLIATASNILYFFSPSFVRHIHNIHPTILSYIISFEAVIPIFLGIFIGKLCNQYAQKVLFWGLILSLFTIVFYINIPLPSSYYIISLVYALIGLSSALINTAQVKLTIESISKRDTSTYMGLYYFVQFMCGGLASIIFVLICEEKSNSSVELSEFLYLLYICAFFYSSCVFLNHNSKHKNYFLSKISALSFKKYR